VPNPADAVTTLASDLTGDEVILVKASRGERLERVVEGLSEQFAAGG
jgi:UDP-N-acetylmuramyl pentapeptide synthase